jgi:glycosyltransferase involved in cell wall biosynthesis
VRDDDFIIQFVGSIIEHKGIFLLLTAFEDICSRYTDVELVIIGDGPETEKLHEQISKSDYKEHIEFLGRRSHKATLTKMASADVLVFPSKRESFGRVVLEAMELGVPVIATPVGSIPHLIDDGYSGIIIDRNEDNIITAIEQLYQNTDIRNRLGENASDQIKHRNEDSVVDRITDTYSMISN